MAMCKRRREKWSKRKECTAYNKTCLTLIAVSNTTAATIFHRKVCLPDCFMLHFVCLELSFWPFTVHTYIHFLCLSRQIKHLKYNFWHSYGITHSINSHTELQRRKLIYWWWTHTNIIVTMSYHLQTEANKFLVYTQFAEWEQKIISLVQKSKLRPDDEIVSQNNHFEKRNKPIFMYILDVCGKKFTVSNRIDLRAYFETLNYYVGYFLFKAQCLFWILILSNFSRWQNEKAVHLPFIYCMWVYQENL